MAAAAARPNAFVNSTASLTVRSWIADAKATLARSDSNGTGTGSVDTACTEESLLGFEGSGRGERDGDVEETMWDHDEDAPSPRPPPRPQRSKSRHKLSPSVANKQLPPLPPASPRPKGPRPLTLQPPSSKPILAIPQVDSPESDVDPNMPAIKVEVNPPSPHPASTSRRVHRYASLDVADNDNALDSDDDWALPPRPTFDRWSQISTPTSSILNRRLSGLTNGLATPPLPSHESSFDPSEPMPFSPAWAKLSHYVISKSPRLPARATTLDSSAPSTSQTKTTTTTQKPPPRPSKSLCDDDHHHRQSARAAAYDALTSPVLPDSTQCDLSPSRRPATPRKSHSWHHSPTNRTSVVEKPSRPSRKPPSSFARFSKAVADRGPTPEPWILSSSKTAVVDAKLRENLAQTWLNRDPYSPSGQVDHAECPSTMSTDDHVGRSHYLLHSRSSCDLLPSTGPRKARKRWSGSSASSTHPFPDDQRVEKETVFETTSQYENAQVAVQYAATRPSGEWSRPGRLRSSRDPTDDVRLPSASTDASSLHGFDMSRSSTSSWIDAGIAYQDMTVEDATRRMQYSHKRRSRSLAVPPPLVLVKRETSQSDDAGEDQNRGDQALVERKARRKSFFDILRISISAPSTPMLNSNTPVFANNVSKQKKKSVKRHERSLSEQNGNGSSTGESPSETPIKTADSLPYESRPILIRSGSEKPKRGKSTGGHSQLAMYSKARNALMLTARWSEQGPPRPTDDLKPQLMTFHTSPPQLPDVEQADFNIDNLNRHLSFTPPHPFEINCLSDQLRYEHYGGVTEDDRCEELNGMTTSGEGSEEVGLVKVSGRRDTRALESSGIQVEMLNAMLAIEQDDIFLDALESIRRHDSARRRQGRAARMVKSPTTPEWKAEVRTLFVVRELIASEKSYRSHLQHLLDTVNSDFSGLKPSRPRRGSLHRSSTFLFRDTSPRDSPIPTTSTTPQSCSISSVAHGFQLLQRHIPALIAVSEHILSRLVDDPTLWGVATAFLSVEEEMKQVVMSWSPIVDEILHWARVSGETWFTRQRQQQQRGGGVKLNYRPWSSDHGHSSHTTTTLTTNTLNDWIPSGTTNNAAAAAFTSSVNGHGGGGGSKKVNTNKVNKTEKDKVTRTTNPVGIRLGLRDIVIMPIQRFTRYPLFVQELLKHVAKSSPGCVMLEQALQTMKGVAETCNLSTSQVDNSLFFARP